MSVEKVAADAGAWFWKTYGEAIVGKAIGAVKAQWEQFNWGQAAETYRQRIKERYGIMRVLGMSRPVPLEDIFTDVFILGKPTAFRRYTIEQLKQDPSQLDKRRVSGLRIVSKENRLFVLGKPGAGKTTFLRYVALQAAEGKVDKIPIFVSLREWSDSGLELIPFMVRQFEICGFPDAQLFIKHLLQAGQAIVLFDGLDEVNQQNDQRAQIIRALNNFTDQYTLSGKKRSVTNKCLITCRIAATEYSFENYICVEIADFDQKQVRTFVSKWFTGNSTKRDSFFSEFAKDEHKGLRELARIPLLLVLLCLAFDETMTFPQRQSDLYKEALDVLLKKWDASRNIKRDEIYRKLSLGRKRQMFACIAAETFEAGDHFLRQDYLAKRIVDYLQKLPPTDTSEDIDGEAVLKAIEAQHGIFVECAHQVYSFAHSTFQEYFAAKYIVDNASDETLRGLMSHVTDDRWREVFLLTASLLADADVFFTLLRRAIDELVRCDELIVKLLGEVEWVGMKASWIKTADSNPFLARACALARALARARAFDNALTRELNINRQFDRACAHALAHDLDRARDPDRARIMARALDSALNLAGDQSRDIETDARLDLTNHLRPALASLAIPTQGATDSEGRAFADKVQAVVASSWDMRYVWKLDRERLEHLEQYLKANVLLTDCLKLANVSDRAGIQNNLLLLLEEEFAP